MQNYSQWLVSTASDAMLKAWVEGGEEYAIRTLDRFALDMCDSLGSVAWLQEHAMNEYRSKQCRMAA